MWEYCSTHDFLEHFSIVKDLKALEKVDIHDERNKSNNKWKTCRIWYTKHLKP